MGEATCNFRMYLCLRRIIYFSYLECFFFLTHRLKWSSIIMHPWKTKKQVSLLHGKACAHPVRDWTRPLGTMCFRVRDTLSLSSVFLLGRFQPAWGCKRAMSSAAGFKPEYFSSTLLLRAPLGLPRRSCAIWHVGVSEEAFCYLLLLSPSGFVFLPWILHCQSPLP